MGPLPEERLPPIPDDASELEPDRLAWLAEQRALRRRTLLRRIFLTRRWERFGLSGPLVVACLLATSVVAALTVVFTPRADPPPAAAPLAAVPELAVPTASPAATDAASLGVGARRLPTVALSGPDEAVDSASLRPALVTLLPAGCRCATSTRALLQQAREFRLPLWLVGTPQAAAELRGTTEATGGTARWAVDGAGSIARAVAAHGLSVALVRADGVVTDVRRDLARDGEVPALELQLARLTRPARDGSTR
jgi:hypothetical protein